MSVHVPVGKMYQRMIILSSSCLKTNVIPLQLSANRLYSSTANATNRSSNKKYYDIVIAGGGMVGCAMACNLCKYRHLYQFSRTFGSLL